MSESADKNAPFYKSAQFYLSLVAIVISVAALTISALNSPYFGFVGARVVYRCEEERHSSGEAEYAVFVINEGNAPAEEALVTIGTTGDGDKAEIFVKGGYDNYSVIQKEKFQVVLRFPAIAPQSSAVIRVGNCQLSFGAWKTNVSFDQDFDVTVVHKTGLGRWLGVAK